MKTMGWRSLMVWGAALAVSGCLVSCEGLSVSLGSDGKFVVSGTVPAQRGKVVILDEKGK